MNRAVQVFILAMFVCATEASGSSRRNNKMMRIIRKYSDKFESAESKDALNKLWVMFYDTWLPPSNNDVDVPDVGDADWGPNQIDDSRRKCGGVRNTLGPMPSASYDGLDIPGINSNNCGEKGTSKKRFSVLEQLLVALSRRDDNKAISEKIVGGEDSRKHEWPFMASLQFRIPVDNRYIHMCGATLIGDRWVLTAAHCFHLIDLWNRPYMPHEVNTCDMRLVLREHDLTESADAAIEMDVEQVFVHPEYQVYGTYNDIALLRLAERVGARESWVRPACLPDPDDELAVHTKCIVPGWGSVNSADFQSTSPTLRHAEAEIYPNGYCSRLDPNIRQTQLCAGNLEGGEDTCAGDSGGPLLCERAGRYFEEGVTSWGARKCGSPGLPAIYTKVSPYMAWIETVLLTETD